MTQTLTLSRPDDMHVHFREGARMQTVVPFTAAQFARAIVMPNTQPFITTVDEATRYREAILAAVPAGKTFTPLMTLYLRDTLSPDEIRQAKRSGIVHGVKFYPQGATTNSHGGVADLRSVTEQLQTMEEVDLPLLVHGESADAAADPFDREAIFYREVFEWLTTTYPQLRIVFEHITTTEAATWVAEAPSHLRIGATITPQHLLVDRRYLCGGSLRPHAFCKPILKRAADRKTLVAMATSGNPRFFLGTDSAPHAQHGVAGTAKEADCGCAGCFTAHAAMELYAEAFDAAGQLHRLDDFASRFGAEFYELPQNQDILTLEQTSWQAQPAYDFGAEDAVVPFRQEVPLRWRMVT